MSQITGAHHTSFTVANLERSLEFFRDVLGLEVVIRRTVRDEYFGAIVALPGCEVEAALLKIPGSAHHLELFEYRRPMGQPTTARPCDPGSSHLALLVDDLRGLCARLAGSGCELVSEPVEITAGPNRGAWAVYLRDPNGILIELFQRAA